MVQNDSLVPGFAALLILRELGAVVSSLLLTSRVGAGLAAEVGSMQVTEQNDALRIARHRSDSVFGSPAPHRLRGRRHDPESYCQFGLLILCYAGE